MFHSIVDWVRNWWQLRTIRREARQFVDDLYSEIEGLETFRPVRGLLRDQRRKAIRQITRFYARLYTLRDRLIPALQSSNVVEFLQYIDQRGANDVIAALEAHRTDDTQGPDAAAADQPQSTATRRRLGVRQRTRPD